MWYNVRIMNRKSLNVRQSKMNVACLAIYLLVGLVALLTGCFSMRGEADSASAKGGYGMDAPQELLAKRSSAPAPSPTSGTVTSNALSFDAAPRQESAGETSQPERRLRIYSGYLDLVVDDVEKQREKIITITKNVKGYVESTSGEFIVIRIPAALFDAVFDDIGDLSEILNRFIETADVTELYQDLGLRLEAARRTRTRLQVLLEKTSDVDERVKILQEIRRLTEEIDRIESSLTLLEGQINLSRITVRLLPRITGSGQGRRSIPFRWIANLQPLTPTIPSAIKELSLVVDDEFAVFQSGKTIRAESAEGTRFRMGAAVNRPDGDAVFWQKALQFHLTDLYRTSRKVEAGSYRGVLFTSKDTVPFHFLVAVKTVKEEILVAETFFPDDAALDRRFETVLAMLEGAEDE
jgi:hypothetical protein